MTLSKTSFTKKDTLQEVIKLLTEIYNSQCEKDRDLYFEYRYKLSDPDKDINIIMQSKDLVNIALKESRINSMMKYTEKLINLYEDYIDEFLNSEKNF